MPDSHDTTPILLAAIDRLDAKLDSKMDAFTESMSRMHGRVGALEAQQVEHVKQRDRFLSQTWPDHEKVVSLLEERVRIVEQEKVTWTKLSELEKRMNEFDTFKAASNVKIAAIIGVSSLVGSGVVTALIRFLWH